MPTALLEREQPRNHGEAWLDYEADQSARGLSGWVAVFCLAASVALFSLIIAPALAGFVYTADDLGEFHLPLRAFYARCLESGAAFDWCPDLYCGFYLTGEGQIGTYHPVHWALYRLLPLGVAWNVECILSYPLMFLGTYLMLLRWVGSRAAALFGAMCFTFCGFNLLHFVHVNAVAVVAHVPWLLWAGDRLVRATERGERLLLAAVIGTLTASQLFVGYPQYVFLSVVGELVVLGVTYWRREARGRRVVSFTWWTLGKFAGLMAAAVQVWPTIEALGDSARMQAGEDFAGWGSLHPLNLVQLIAPYLFESRVVGQNTHELSLYVGCVPLVLAIFALCGRKGGGRTTVAKRFALFAVVIGFVLALGANSPLHTLIDSLPVLGSFRFPCRAIVLVQLGMMTLAAIGLARLLAGRDGQTNTATQFPQKMLLALVTVSVLLAIGAPLLWSEYTAPLALVWLGPGLVLMATMLTRFAAHGSRWAILMLVVAAACDFFFYGFGYAVYRSPQTLERFIAETPVPPAEPPQRVVLDAASTMDRDVRSGNRLLLAGYSRVDGYAGLAPSRVLDYRTQQAQRAAGADWVHGDVQRLPGSVGAAADWLAVKKTMPRASLVSQVIESDEPRMAIHRVDLTSTAVVAPGDVSLAPGSGEVAGETDAVRVVRDEPGLIEIEVDAATQSLLVLTESFHRGWTVEGGTEGAAVNRTTCVNGDFLGCLIDPGPRTVTFRFAPESLVWGRAISILGLGLLVSLFGFAGRSFARRT